METGRGNVSLCDAGHSPAEACVKYTFAASVTARKDAPDLWVADSAVRVQRVVTAPAPEITVGSRAPTPGVIVGRQGEIPAFGTWLGALQDSLSLEELLAALELERDPARPVVIVSIGITDDADAGTLRRLSEATGSTSYVARNPRDIPSVFVDALQARAQ